MLGALKRDGSLDAVADRLASFEEQQRASNAAGFGRITGLGQRLVRLMIDVRHYTTGTAPIPVWPAIEKYPISRGEVACAAVTRIERLIGLFRERGRSSTPSSPRRSGSTRVGGRTRRRRS